MKFIRKYETIIVVLGAIVTAFMAFIFLPKLIGSVWNDGFGPLGHQLINWYDSPTGFSLSYFVCYIVAWKNKLIGSLIMISASVLVLIVNSDNLGFLIFAGPTITVGILYYLLEKSLQLSAEEDTSGE